MPKRGKRAGRKVRQRLEKQQTRTSIHKFSEQEIKRNITLIKKDQKKRSVHKVAERIVKRTITVVVFDNYPGKQTPDQKLSRLYLSNSETPVSLGVSGRRWVPLINLE